MTGLLPRTDLFPNIFEFETEAFVKTVVLIIATTPGGSRCASLGDYHLGRPAPLTRA